MEIGKGEIMTLIFNHMGTAGVHRFHEYAALSCPVNRTVYLDLKSARRLHKSLGKICRSIEREAFTASVNLTDHGIPVGVK